MPPEDKGHPVGFADEDPPTPAQGDAPPTPAQSNWILTWFAHNRVAANLLMALIVVVGLLSLGRLQQEVVPQVPSNLISVTVPYPGAAPEEVETAVCNRIEERVQDVTSVERVRSVAAENLCTVTIEAVHGADLRAALDDVKTRVDSIDSFPEDVEKPIVQEVELRLQLLDVVISGPADELTLRRLGEQVRDEIAALPGITRVNLGSVRPYEIAIEVSEETLRRHRLTFDQIAQSIRRSSLDLSGGTINTEGGDILLRTHGQAYRQREFEDLVLLTRPDGTRLLLGEVATVIDRFAETGSTARFDGLPAVVVQVFRVGEQRDTKISARVRAYLEEARTRLPDGIQLTVWQDDTSLLEDRLGTLLRNGASGLVLVLLVLALFLRLRLALWVAIGIPVAFLGTLGLLPSLGQSINMVSLLAFIVVLGMVVDDAIIVGENIHRHHEMGKGGVEAAVAGVQEVAVPVTFAALTTIAAFAPLLNLPGPVGIVMRAYPVIVIATLAVSLIESLLILPSHLTHLRPRLTASDLGNTRQNVTQRLRDAWGRCQDALDSSLEWIDQNVYQRLLRRAIAWRYSAVATAVAALLLSLGYVASGHLRFSPLPPVEADNLVAFLVMPQGTPADVTAETLDRLEMSARELERELTDAGGLPFRHILTSIGDQPFRARQTSSAVGVATNLAAPHLGEVTIELAPADQRTSATHEMLSRWRQLTGQIPDAVELSFNADLFSTGAPIDIQLAARSLEELHAATAEVKAALGRYPGVSDVTDSIRIGKQEIRISITPEAESLGLNLGDLARQVRQAFYGEEAQRIQRGRDEVRVMVRYPEQERSSLANLEAMRIRTPDGDEVPFGVVARLEPGRGLAAIEHTDGKRTIKITADVDRRRTSSSLILADLELELMPKILADYPGLSYSIEGQQKQQRESTSGVLQGFLLALFAIYALLAIPFRSYLLPLVIMSAIPFGMIGAFAGHALMGRDLTVNSLIGIVALSGVVVNDSLVLVDFIHRLKRGGIPLRQAIYQAGARRFRPIVLTSLTTFAGLTPLLLERSEQAQLVIPMAISLAFGVLFASVIVLLLVPVSYCILEDVRASLNRYFSTSRA